MRPFRDEDAPAIAAACDDPDTARFIPGMPSPYSDDDALAEGGVRRLELTTHPENGASQRVAEKAGFRRVGVREHDLAFGDGRRESVVFELP